MEVATIKADQTLDVKGMSCPMPLLKTKKAIDAIASGQVLEIIGTDPGSKNDMPNWCARTGHEYLGEKEASGCFCFYIRKV